MNSTISVGEHLMNGPLSAAEVEQFISTGFVKIPAAFDAGPGSDAARWIEESWAKVGADKNDPETWPYAVTRVDVTATPVVRDFAPRVYHALGQLMGGQENVVDPTCFGLWGPVKEEFSFSNGFLINFKFGSDKPWIPPGPDVIGWHVDGDWFTHFLDSMEQGLLIIVCWADMVHQGGATFMAPDSIKPVAEFLRDHPEGCGPNDFATKDIIAQCQDFREVIGSAGDVFLMHPFMMHSSSYNAIERPRFMTNPAVSRAHPMQFNRPDGKYDAMETAVLRALGVDHIDFEITSPRRQFPSGGY